MADVVHLDPDLAPGLAARGLDGLDALAGLGGPLAPGGLVTAIELPLPGTVGRFHLKRYHYPGWRKARHLLGRGTLGGTPPEVAEYRALAWLRAHDLPAPRPVAAAARTRCGRLVTHLLLTEHVPGTQTLAEALAGAWAADRRRRRAGLQALADLVGRMHAAGFVHRDLRARNVLVAEAPAGGTPALWLLDCRRGGRPTWRRGPRHDLASLDLDLRAHLARTERVRLLRRWAGRQGRSPETWRRTCARLPRPR